MDYSKTLNSKLHKQVQQGSALCNDGNTDFASQKTSEVVILTQDQTTISTLLQLGPEEIKAVGCPKGTTKMDIHDKQLCEKQCLDDITKMYMEKRLTSAQYCVPNGWLQRVIDSKKIYNLPDLVVNYTTIHSCLS